MYGVFGYKSMPKWLWLSVAKTAYSSVMPTSVPAASTSTSRIYTDFGIIAADEQITADVSTLFTEIHRLGQAGPSE